LSAEVRSTKAGWKGGFYDIEKVAHIFRALGWDGRVCCPEAKIGWQSVWADNQSRGVMLDVLAKHRVYDWLYEPTVARQHNLLSEPPTAYPGDKIVIRLAYHNIQYAYFANGQTVWRNYKTVRDLNLRVEKGDYTWDVSPSFSSGVVTDELDAGFLARWLDMGPDVQDVDLAGLAKRASRFVVLAPSKSAKANITIKI
jgi:hypothetical protein